MNAPENTQGWGSQQARLYRRARRDGQPLEIAATIAGISFGEAKLHDAEAASSPFVLPEEAFDLLYDPALEPREIASGIHCYAPFTPELDPGKDKTMPKQDAPTSEDPEGDMNPLVEITAGTMRGDVRDALMAWIKARPKMWPLMSETEQRDAYNSADSFGWEICKQIAERIAAEERPTIVAKLVEYKEKDGIEAKLKLSATAENIVALHKACGLEVLLVASGIEQFSAEASPPDINPDQPIMDLGGEYENQ